MLTEIKQELLKNTDAIVTLLEHYSFAHIRTSSREIRFARSEAGGNNISIRLENNDNLYVNDFARGVSKDIFAYIVAEKNAAFRDVLQQTKLLLGLDAGWRPVKKQALFSGIYDNIGCPNRDIKLKVYDESILDQYQRVPNMMFWRDGISFEAQKFWDIRYSAKDNAIIIPIRNEFGDLVGTKARVNGPVQEGESKYFYTIPFQMSQVLYGYNENYSYLYGNDAVIVESEKSVCQAYTLNYRNIVAVGSSSISEKQSKLILQLLPKRIIIAHDEGIEFEQIKRNADMIKSCCSMFTPEIYYWDSTMDLDIGEKCSLTDMGKDKFEEIMEEQLVRIY